MGLQLRLQGGKRENQKHSCKVYAEPKYRLCGYGGIAAACFSGGLRVVNSPRKNRGEKVHCRVCDVYDPSENWRAAPWPGNHLLLSRKNDRGPSMFASKPSRHPPKQAARVQSGAPGGRGPHCCSHKISGSVTGDDGASHASLSGLLMRRTGPASAWRRWPAVIGLERARPIEVDRGCER